MTMLEAPARNLRLFSEGKRIANGDVRSFMTDWLGLPPNAATSTASGIISQALHQSGANDLRYAQLCQVHRHVELLVYVAMSAR